jgi:hypothetical protein
MIGKGIVGVVIAVVMGGLIMGAINRTTSRNANSRNINAENHESGSLGVQNGEGYGGGRNGGQGEGDEVEASDFQEDQVGIHGFASNETAGKGIAVGVNGWIEAVGVVTGLEADLLEVQLADGSVIEVSRRAWWFAQEQGFSASIGDGVNLSGFFEGDEFETAKLDNLTTGFSVAIRDENGRPLWAGKGG